jgi:hypothetical protein
MIQRKESLTFYLGFIIIYITLGVYNYINRSQWIIDNILSIIAITILFILIPGLKFGKWEYFFCCIGFLIHNLGTFGFYELSFRFLNYDDIVHLSTTAIAGYVIFNFLAKSIVINNIKKVNLKPKLNNFNKALTMILIVVSIVTSLGVFIEQVEFMGFMYLGPGEGILFYGSGDGENPGEVRSQYIDTIKDMNMNFIGSLMGTLFYYFKVYKRKDLSYI